MRLVVISDTHSLHRMVTVPPGDVLIHCGDFCGRDLVMQVEDVAEWMAQHPHPHKIVIAGNHDVMFERAPHEFAAPHSFTKRGILYLCDSGTVIEGVKFWGSPWQPEFCDWAFNLPRGEALAEKWALIPDDIDVLITHGPPKNILDGCPPHPPSGHRGMPRETFHAGCKDLRAAIFDRVRPKVHLFGHIHEGSGEHTEDGIRFVNASICTGDYRPVNPARVVDL